jgi:hypothetical protein
VPTYQYKGHEFSSERDLSPDEWKQTLAHLDSLGEARPAQEEPKPVQETAWYEDLGAGLKGAFDTAVTGIGSGVASLTTGERQQEIIGDVQSHRKAIQEHEAGLNRGESGKVLKAIGGIPAFLNPVTAGAVIAGGATETGLQLLDDGGSTGTALAGMGADAGINLATMGAAGKLQVASKVGNAALQGGVNVAQEALLNHPIQNAIRSNADIKALPDMTIGDYAAAYIPGHVIGHMTATGKTGTPKEVPLPEGEIRTQADLTDPFVTRLKIRMERDIKDIVELKDKQESLVGSDGTMSEKQANAHAILQEKIDDVVKAYDEKATKLSKYEEVTPKPEVLSSKDQEISNIKNMDIFGDRGVNEPPPLGSATKPTPVDKLAAIIAPEPPKPAAMKPFVPETTNPAKASPSAAIIQKKTEVANKIVNDLDSNYDIDVQKIASAADVLADAQARGLTDATGTVFGKFQREMSGMGQFVEAVKRDAPVVWETYKRIKRAYDTEINLKRTWWYGDATGKGVKANVLWPFMKLTHWLDPDSPSTVVSKMSVNDKIAVKEYMVETSNRMVRHVPEGDVASFTPEQTAMAAKYNALSESQQKAVQVFQKMYDRIQRTTGTDRVKGYIHAIRKGDFAVGLKTIHGDVAHIESFPTKKIADNFIAMAKKAGHDTTDLIDFSTEAGKSMADSLNLARDIIDTMGNKDLKKREWTINEIGLAQQKLAEKSTIGSHNIRKEGYLGFAGTELFKSRKQNAEDFFKSMESYTQGSAVQWKKTLLNREMSKFFETPEGEQLKKMFPDQYETSQHLIDVAMNNNQKYGIATEMDKIRIGIDNLFVEGVHKANKLFGKKENPLYYPEIPVLDKATGMAAQLFYIRTLTSRPAFWVGQMLSSPFSGRQFLKEGTLLESLVSQGKGWGTIMSGGTKEFRAFMKEFVNTTDSTHPQFKNDMNEIPFFDSKTNVTLDKAFNWVTGQTPAGMADTFSRYAVIAQAYHFYEAKGFKGEQLKRNVQNMVDNTMVMYDRTHSPPFLSKLGIIGQNIAPLQKYGIAQLQNLVGDLKFIGQQKGGLEKLKATAPAISTLMTTMIMAGSVGLPLLMEYEMLRMAFVKTSKFFGWTDVEDYVPKSVMEVILTDSRLKDAFASSMHKATGMEEETAKNLATHGALSAATGMDMGSSLRFNPVVPGADGTHEVALINAFPVIKSSLDLADLGLTKLKKYTGADITEAELRKADLGWQMFPGQRALQDKFKYDADERSYVPGGTRGYAQVEQTPKEQLAMALGTTTLSTVKDRTAVQLEMTNDKALADKKQKAIDMITDSITSSDSSRLDRGMELAVKSGLTNDQIKKQVKAALHERNTPRLMDRFTNQKGQIKSVEQKRKAERVSHYD